MVGHADLIVLNTDRLLADFSARYPDSVEKLFTIPNGYDLPLPRVPKLAVALDRKPVRLIHAGSLYGRRDPLPLLSALADLIAAGEVDEEAVELVFLGELSDKLNLPAKIGRLGLDRCVKIRPSIPKVEAKELLREADVLLLLQPEAPLQIPSKVFDYLVTGKPILALVGAGATADFVSKAQIGLTVDPLDSLQIRAALAQLLTGGYETRPNWEYLAEFSGERLSRRLEDLLLARSN